MKVNRFKLCILVLDNPNLIQGLTFEKKSDFELKLNSNRCNELVHNSTYEWIVENYARKI